MPVVTISRKALFDSLGETFSDTQFYDLCFEFGIELDDVSPIEGSVDNDVEYKIEIPANRYDLLCQEGLVRALRMFRGKDKNFPQYRTSKPAQPLRLVCKKSVQDIRPIVVCGVLRNLKFTQANYDSFIALQEKLHHNICRKRTLVSVGTHDLDTIQGPFSYEARVPTDIKFVPLNEKAVMNADELFDHITKHEAHLKEFLPIIRGKPKYPVIYDSKNVVLSLPPIINGDHSKITLETKNVFIEVTATDKTKASIVLDTIVAMFGQYTSDPFVVEQVEIQDEASGSIILTPDFTQRTTTASLKYLNEAIGVEIKSDHVVECLRRMCLPAEVNGDTVIVKPPPTRSDILHACDIMEDVAIGYGFNKILSIAKPPPTATPGSQRPLNKLCDQLRTEIAQAGFTEILSLSLCSTQENYSDLRKKDDGKAVRLANPKTQEYQVARTQLYVGLLKTLNANKKAPLPLKVFEISDTVEKSEAYDVGAKNVRHLCVININTTAGFETIHGLVDRIMTLLEIRKSSDGINGYAIKPGNDSTYLPNQCAEIFLNGKKVGVMGTLHPEVLINFDLNFPAAALHLEVEPLL